MKEIQITLYEIFGYLIPGSFFAGSVTMVYWTIFENNSLVITTIEPPLWLLIIAVSYLAGHVTQSIANILLRKTNAEIFLKGNSDKSVEEFLIDGATEMVKRLICDDITTKIKPSTLIETCEALLQHKGCGQTREIYLYREGFYRGMFVSLGFLSIALTGRLFVVQSVFAFGNNFTHTFHRVEIGALSILCAAISWLFFTRFRRFGKYLIRHTLISALLLSRSNKSSELAN